MIEMSRDSIRFSVLVLCVSAVAAAAAGWVATGGIMFSRSPSGDGERVVERELVGEGDRFAIVDETGVNEGLEEPDSVGDVFAIGLLPGGPRDPVSVATVAGLSGVLLVVVLVLTRGRSD